jgi:hypothetical protein
MLTFIEHGKPKPLTPNIGKLMARIKKVLDGHLIWIFTKAGTLENGTFSPHHWPSGHLISDWDYLSPPSLIDTPIQLLKIFWILRIDPKATSDSTDSVIDKDSLKSTVGSRSVEALKLKIEKWILELHETNRQGSYAFLKEYDLQDPKDRADAKFRLTDHVMICLALQCADELIPKQTPDDSNPRKYYAHDQVRERILKRFTIQSPMSKQKTLATCRTSEWTR